MGDWWMRGGVGGVGNVGRAGRGGEGCGLLFWGVFIREWLIGFGGGKGGDWVHFSRLARLTVSWVEVQEGRML